MTIAVVNTKGGASKSTVAFQVAAASFLAKKQEVQLIEFDDENKDSETFSNSKIKSSQVEIGDGTDVDEVLKDTLLVPNDKNLVIDVGGNKTTTIIIEGLKKTRLYRKIDLFIIPMSGGYQDLKNAEKTYAMIKDFGVPVIFALSRVRNPKRLQFQYGDFFRAFQEAEYLILTESDVVDLSRRNGKSIYEIAFDEAEKRALEEMLDDAFDDDDNRRIAQFSTLLQIYDESEAYVEKILSPAFEVIEQRIIDGCQA
jgi:CO dehydrogenase nickel-insertion accessory protein CooC1